jgi:hypothetical protein
MYGLLKRLTLFSTLLSFITISLTVDAWAMDQQPPRTAFKEMLEILIDKKYNDNTIDGALQQKWQSFSPQIQTLMIKGIQNRTMFNESKTLQKYATSLNTYFAVMFNTYLMDVESYGGIPVRDGLTYDKKVDTLKNKFDKNLFAFVPTDKDITDWENLLDQNKQLLATMLGTTSIMILLKPTLTHIIRTTARREFIKIACSFLNNKPEIGNISEIVARNVSAFLKQICKSTSKTEWDACIKQYNLSYDYVNLTHVFSPIVCLDDAGLMSKDSEDSSY